MPEKYHPRLKQYAHAVSAKTKYPIENFGQLLKALGGENAAIEFEGPRGPAGKLRDVIPHDFFPVHSEADLLKKSEALRKKYMP